MSIIQSQCNRPSLYEVYIIFRFFQWIWKEKWIRKFTAIKMLTQMHAFLHLYLAANPHLSVISCLFFSRPDLEQAWQKTQRFSFKSVSYNLLGSKLLTWNAACPYVYKNKSVLLLFFLPLLSHNPQSGTAINHLLLFNSLEVKTFLCYKM